jgi:putative SOS response-associated peptidase YedK
MCGRFLISASKKDLAAHFGLYDLADVPVVVERYNVAPTQDVLAVRDADGERELVSLRWGLVPSWAADLKVGNKHINARAETVAEKPSFRSAFKKRRCLVPASGFYE